MATARAIANGNWSATSTWNGGVLPGNGDTVYASGFNVTINQNIDIGGANNPTVNAGSFVAGQWYEIVFVGTTSWTGVGAASNTAGTIFLATGVGSGTGTAKALATLTTTNNTSAGAAAGGTFTMSSPFAITTDLRAGTTTCLTVTGATALTLDGLRVIGGSAVGANACNYNGTTSCTLANSTLTGGNANNCNALSNNNTGTINVSDSCQINGGRGGTCNGILNASTGTINVSANCVVTGGSNSGINNGILNASTGTINVSASCTFIAGSGGTTPCALNNTSTGTINVSASCAFTAGSALGSSALNNGTSGTVIVTQGTFTASAFSAAVSIVSTTADVRLSGDFLDHWSGWKAISGDKWRLGTAPTLSQTRYALAGTTDSYFTMYGADNGTFGNPIAANVRSGTVYGGGNLTGTCAVPAAGSVALGVPVDNTTGTAVLTPAAVWGHATRTITGGLVDTATTLTNAPASVTPSDIWSHSSRTLTSASGPTAVQIRQEIDANSTKLDVAVGTRLASSAYTAPANSDVAAIKAKTDAINTTRLGQCTTTEILGNLLAQANS